MHIVDPVPLRHQSPFLERLQNGTVGVEDDGGVEYDLALARRAVELLVVLQGGLAGGKEKIPALMVRRDHVQGAHLRTQLSELGAIATKAVQANTIAAEVALQRGKISGLAVAAQQQIDRRRPDDNQQDDQTDPF